ncbi:CGNR zinc finger domain-containing protein [Streptomyces capparidis]
MPGTSQELRFDTGRTCLDLLATAGRSLGRDPVDRLRDPQRLREWLVLAGLVPAGAPVPVDERWLRRFRGARELLRRIVRAEMRGAADARDLELLARLCLPPPPAPRVRRGRDGQLRCAFAAEPDCAGLLSLVARDAVALLTDPRARGCLRECAGESCDVIYLDTSRGHRRRWCSSELCGNRERVARHRRRTVTSAG